MTIPSETGRHLVELRGGQLDGQQLHTVSLPEDIRISEAPPPGNDVEVGGGWSWRPMLRMLTYRNTAVVRGRDGAWLYDYDGA